MVDSYEAAGEGRGCERAEPGAKVPPSSWQMDGKRQGQVERPPGAPQHARLAHSGPSQSGRGWKKPSSGATAASVGIRSTMHHSHTCCGYFQRPVLRLVFAHATFVNGSICEAEAGFFLPT